jgi:hypothetical protein
MPPTDPITSVVDDQLSYQLLDDLFDNTNANIQSVNNTLVSIGQADQYYTGFSTYMDQYTRYEQLIQARLNQLKDFVNDESTVLAEEASMTTLENTMNASTNAYKIMVQQNNQKAVQVQQKYDTVKESLSALAKRAADLGKKQYEYTWLIYQKRGKDYAKGTVILNVNGTKVAPVTFTANSPITFQTTNYTAHPNITGYLNLGFNFGLHASTFDEITYGYAGMTDTTPKSVTFNIEVLSIMVGTTPKTMDTSTKFLIVHTTTDDANVTIQNSYEVTSLSTKTFSMKVGDKFKVLPQTDIKVTTGIFSVTIPGQAMLPSFKGAIVTP